MPSKKILQDQLEIKAIRDFATQRHAGAGNMYGDKPYAAHLLEVVKIAEQYLNLVPQLRKMDVLKACWCHDLLEDAGVSYDELKRLIGHKSAEVVYAVTDELGRNRKERALKTYLKILANPLAMFVKLCDRIANTEHSKHDNLRIHGMYQREFVQFHYVLCTEDYFSRYEAMWERLLNV